MAISRMQEPKQLMSNGGILTLEDAKRMAPPGESLAYINKDEARLLKSRGGAGEDINGTGIKSYFLKKVFKKAKRAVKKVAKSKLGKAAMIGALSFGIPGTGIGGLFGRASFMTPGGLGVKGLLGQKGIAATLGAGRQALASRFAPTIGRQGFNAARLSGSTPKASFFSKLNPFGKNFDAKTAFLTAGAGAVAAPFIADAMAPEEVEEEVDVMDVDGIRQSARDYYTGLGGKNLAFMPQKQYVQKNFYDYADGGRVELMNGGGAENAQAEQMLIAEYVKYKNKGGTLSFEQFVKAVMQQQQAPEGAGVEQPMAMAANGGRIGYSNGGSPFSELEIFKLKNLGFDIGSKGVEPFGGVEVLKEILRVNRADGGIMNTEEAEMIDMGGMEKDYRNEGGFVAMGGKERADDVPARLSKNEFVFTADAVRNAGGGNIDKGAEVMENLMNNLEAGGEVSEESQGLEGAQEMYDQQQMLQSRMI